MSRIVTGLLLLAILALSASAGGGPENVLIVVNDNSSRSLEIGQYYQDARGIPERNICHLNTTTNYSIDTAAFTNQIRRPIFDYIAQAGLSGQVDYIVFSVDFPYRVYLTGSSYNTNSLTGAMFYDYKNSPPPCSLPPAALSSYYEAEEAFSHTGTTGNGSLYISSMLTAWDLDQARRLVDRAASADAACPTGTTYYLRPPDNDRNVRWHQFEGAMYPVRFLAVPRSSQYLAAWYIQGKNDVIGYMLGRTQTEHLDDNVFLPGALADLLTSYSGYLFDNPWGAPSSCLEWIRVGCAGTYGTVVEPCNYTNKFPQARLHYWYARGFSMGEAFTMSVQAPYQGILVGDPLCQPYSRGPLVTVDGLTDGQTVTGSVSVTVTSLCATAQGSISRIDLFLDGLRIAVLTNVAVTPLNVVTATINGQDCTYLVQSGDRLPDVASGLASAINNNATGVTARSSGDRVEIVQDALGVSGTGMTYSATTSTNSFLGGDLTTFAWTPGTNFAETTFFARQRIVIHGAVESGDIVRAVITRLDGAVFTNEAVADADDSSRDLMEKLHVAINNDTNLQGTGGAWMRYVGTNKASSDVEAYIEARTNTWDSYNIYLDYQVIGPDGSNYSGRLTSNADVMGARAEIMLTEGRTQLVAGYVLDTTTYPDGPHTLAAVAYDGSAVRAQGRRDISFSISNSSLSCWIEEPTRGKLFDWGAMVTVSVNAAGGTVTGITLFVEGKQYALTNTLPAVFIWDTSQFGPGLVGIQARAWPPSGPGALSDEKLVRVQIDRDADDLPDWWEYAWFGAATTTTGSADDDGDGASNRAEFLADTQPTNTSHFFGITNILRRGTGDSTRITFISSTQRLYNIFLKDAQLCSTQNWYAAETNSFWGEEADTTWSDDSADPTGGLRFYRVRAELP